MPPVSLTSTQVMLHKHICNKRVCLNLFGSQNIYVVCSKSTSFFFLTSYEPEWRRVIQLFVHLTSLRDQHYVKFKIHAPT